MTRMAVLSLALCLSGCSIEYCGDLERVKIYQIGSVSTGVQFPDGTRLLREGTMFGAVGDEFSARKCSDRRAAAPEYWR